MSRIQRIETADIPQVTLMYAEVFAGKPWYEVSRCSTCGEFSSSSPESSTACSKCSGVCDQEAYPYNETIQYVLHELSKPDAMGLLAVQSGIFRTIEGFGWGYAMSNEELQEKYKTEEMHDLIRRLVAQSSFYYISEVGVLEKYQGRGIGTTLTRKLFDHAEQYPLVVLRTNENSPMRTIAEKVGMTPVLGLNTGIKDAENESRVLFAAVPK